MTKLALKQVGHSWLRLLFFVCGNEFIVLRRGNQELRSWKSFH